MKSDEEHHALALLKQTRPWWKPTLLAAAFLCLSVGCIIQSVQLQLAQRDLRHAVAGTAAIATENRRLAVVAAETALHTCKVTQALVAWAKAVGPLERAAAGDVVYHAQRRRAFDDLRQTLYREDGVPCGDAPK